MELRNKTIVLTGATGGIGRQIAKKLDQKGSNLVLISKSDSELKNLLKTLKGTNHVSYDCNLAVLPAVQKLGEELSANIPRVDVLINCAGVGVYKPIEELSVAEWTEAVNINLNAAFVFTKYLIEKLKTSPESAVVNFGSGNGMFAVAGRSSYCATKFALRGWSLSMSEEFKRTNVSFILLSLGSVLTAFGPMTLEEKIADMESGKGYLTPESVTDKLCEILESETKESEYKIFPSGYEPVN